MQNFIGISLAVLKLCPKNMPKMSGVKRDFVNKKNETFFSGACQSSKTSESS
jgi:hypothetical protein